MEHLKTMQATRKKVTGSYQDHDDPDDVVTALTYMDSFRDTETHSANVPDQYVSESYHILKLEDSPDGKYYLIIETSEYSSDDLEELEKLLCEWMTDEGCFDEDKNIRPHQPNLSPDTYAIVYIKVENPEPHKELLRRPQNPTYDGIKDKLTAKLASALGDNPESWWIDDIHNEWLTGS